MASTPAMNPRSYAKIREDGSLLGASSRIFADQKNSFLLRASSRIFADQKNSFLLRASSRFFADQKGWSEAGLVLLCVLVALVAHGFNMFNYPAFTFNGDEGIYTGQALAVLRQGQLSPYTYWYDHAPGGWILLAAWMAISGGPHTFGSVIDSGRVLMLLLHLAMIPRLYRLVRHFGGGPMPAALATLLFSLSPLAVFYQRPLMLDSLMLFWLLISLDLLIDGWGRLSRVALSGVCFGLALVTKETAIFLLPAMLFIAVSERRRHQGRFAVGGWLLPMLIVTSWYPLYAVMKGELLPIALSAQLFGNTQPHAALLETLIWQMQRGGGGMFNPNNQFWQFVYTDWLVRDPLLLVGGALATILNLLRGLRDRKLLAAGLLGALPLYYLARGGLVFNFYILFAIPFFCLNMAVLIAPLFARLPTWAGAALAILMIVGVSANYWSNERAHLLYVSHTSEAGRKAITWVRDNLPPQSMIIADDAFWPDLRVPDDGVPAFPNVHSHWKVGADPAVAEDVFHNDWHTVDYLIMTPGLEKNFEGVRYPIALEAWRHARWINGWTFDGTAVEVWQVDKGGTASNAPR